MSSFVMNTQQITGIAIKIALIREGKEIQAKIFADLIRYVSKFQKRTKELMFAFRLIEEKKTS